MSAFFLKYLLYAFENIWQQDYFVLLTLLPFFRFSNQKRLKYIIEHQAKILNTVHDLVFITDIAGNILFINKWFKDITGYSPINFDNVCISALLINSEEYNSALASAQKKGHVETGNFLKLQGNREIEVNITVTRLRQQKVTVLVWAFDTGHIKMGTSVLVNQKFNQLADLLPEIVFEADISGKITFANKTAIETFGYTAEQIRGGLTIYQLVHESEKERIRNNLAKKIAGENLLREEYLARKSNGNVFPALAYVDLVYQKDKISGIRGILVDITDSKEREKELKNTYNLTHKLIRHAPFGIMALKGTGRNKPGQRRSCQNI
ncbi:MAG: PAS domain S-box protein [Bacteroidales bacterium]|nr:PAS domain S-box protein [Bacteroidales bacterium]